MPTETFFNLPETKRHRLMEIAIEEFAANDYESASISRIVERAGIAKGSFYQYFTDKRELYRYLLEMAAGEKKRFFQQFPFEPDADLFAYLRYLFQAGLQFEFSHPGLAQIAYRAVYGGGPKSGEAAAHLRRNSAAYFRELVANAQQNGQIDAGLDPDLVAFMLNQIFTGFGDFLLGRLSLDPAKLIEGVVPTLDTPGYWHDIDHLLSILQSGLRPRTT